MPDAVPNKQQERLDRLRESANDSARNYRTVFVSYLVIALYILITISSTGDEALLLGSEVRMPIIDVGVPLVWFSVVGPLLLFILHFNLLIQAHFLSRKVQAYRQAVKASPGEISDEQLDLLFPAPLAHLIGGSARNRNVRFLLWLIALITLILLPGAIVVYAQVQFLPYQSEGITWIHRAVVLADLVLVWWLFPVTVDANGRWDAWWRRDLFNVHRVPLLANLPWFAKRGTAPLRQGATLLFATAVIFFVVGIADFPGGAVDRLVPFDAGRDVLGRHLSLVNKILVKTEPPPEILASVVEKDPNASVVPGSPIWCSHAEGLDLRGISLRHANLRGAVLCDADLKGVDLQVAQMTGAKLHGADLRGAELHNATLLGAELHGADLRGAELHGADLHGAELHGADLRLAGLYGADLSDAKLHGADLSNAKLIESKLAGADLTDARLEDARLHGADLTNARLAGANLWHAQLYGAVLRNAELYGANLALANLQAATLIDAKLQGADLRSVELHAADLSAAKARGADLRRAELYRARLNETELAAADLRYAKANGATFAGANLSLADLRRLDLRTMPDWDDAVREVEEDIISASPSDNSELLSEILATMNQATDHEDRIDPDSVNYALYNRSDPLADHLAENPAAFDDRQYAAYLFKLETEFVGLVCEPAYEPWVPRALADRAFELGYADPVGAKLTDILLNRQCADGRRIMEMLPEDRRANLEEAMVELAEQ